MVTGEKPDEQVDWSEVAAAADAASREVIPFADALDALARGAFGVPVWAMPSWMPELLGLEAAHGRRRLRGRARRRLGSLRKRERAWLVGLERRAQRRRIGLS